MFLISLLIFLIIVFFLYFLIIQKIPLKIIAKSSNAKIRIQAQSGLFSFSSLVLESSQYTMTVIDSKVRINLLGLLSTERKLINILISRIHVYKHIAKEKNIQKNEAYERQVFSPENEMKNRIFSQIGFYFFRFCEMTVNQFELEDESLSQRIETSFKVHYERRDVSSLSVDFGDTFFKKKDFKIIELKRCSFSVVIELVVIFNILSQAKTIFLSKWKISDMTIETDGSTITVKPSNFSINFSPGNCQISFSALILAIPYTLPQTTISLTNIDFITQIPLQQINYRELNQIYLNFEEFNVKIVSDHFLRLNSVSVSIGSLSKFDFDIDVDKLFFHYSSLDGIPIFKLYKQLRNPVYSPSRIRFAFPEGKVKVKYFAAKLYLTDKARVKGTSENVIYTDKAIQFDELKLFVNKVKLAVAKNFKISSPDETFFTFSADSLVAHDRHLVPIDDFIMNIIYAWRIIKPWASANVYDSETLPFPIRIIVKRVCAKIHDSPVNSKLTTLSVALPNFLQEKLVMQHIFDTKINSLQFSKEQSNNAAQKLSELYFTNYQDIFKKLKFHKYILKMTVTDFDVKLDSRNVAPGMENLLHKFDPTTAELHPVVEWETLEGLKIDATIGSYVAEMTTLKKPFMEGRNATLRGTLIVGEISDGRFIDVSTTVYKQPLIAPGTATDVKLYCDMSANAEFFEWYFGGPTNKLIDDFADAIIAFIPEAGIDPSPPLRWWDTLRNVFRGRYVANVSNIVTNFVGGTILDDQENIMILDAKDARLQITEGNFILNTKMCDLRRTRNGPIICHLPNFSMDWSILWKTKGGNPRKHLIIPDVDRFGDPEYDTYNEFRAIEYTFTFVFNFTNDKISPFFTFDIAHLAWIFDPLISIGTGPFLNECYDHKFGVSKYDPTKYDIYFFSSLPCYINIKLNTTPTLSLRAFDHFPVKESTINGTSIDATMQNFVISLNCDLTKPGDSHIAAYISSESVTFNTTDLWIYSKFSKELSTAFMVFNDVIFKYDEEKMHISVPKIRIIANQFNAKYISEYLEAFIHFLPAKGDANEDELPLNNYNGQNKKMSIPSRLRQSDNDLLTHLLRRRSSQKTVTAQRGKENRIINQTNKSRLDSFSTPIITLDVPKVEILLESLQYDARLLAVVNSVNLNINKDKVLDLFCVQLLVDSLVVKQNVSFEPQDVIKIPDLISIHDIRFQLYQSVIAILKETHYEASISSLNLNANSNDIALIKQFIQEIEPSQNKNALLEKEAPVEPKRNGPSFVDFTIEQFNAQINDLNSGPIGSLVAKSCAIRFDTKMDNITESSIYVQDLNINDIRPDALNKIVCKRWNLFSEENVISPLIRFQCKIPPPVGGITVVNHLEINVDPTVVNYEATFFTVLIQFVLSKALKCAPFFQLSYEFPKSSYVLPSMLLEPNVLPSTEEGSKYMEENKSKEISLMTDKADEHVLLRYFKITSTKLNVSYHNPESKVPDINEFNGLFHEINYQDFNVTMETLIERLVADISSDLIPQFLKHMIGLGKIQESEESTFNTWLANDQEKQPSRQKAMLFGRKKPK